MQDPEYVKNFGDSRERKQEARETGKERRGGQKKERKNIKR